ncbi:MAG: hypothetical protein IPF98_11735 [Gemmatimonadetes bacterium]|nr:hypothetical protein [Gemmatimonadota bacterium]MCC6769575.1 hypothetical protein [Gemmatimonadaceae bacterium]
MRVPRSARLAITALLAVLAACGDDGNAPPPPTGSFTLALAPTTVTIVQGQTGTIAATLARTDPFVGAVALTLESATTGISGTFDPASVPAGATSSTLTISVTGTVAPGDYPVTVRATATGLTDLTTTATITVTAAQVPDFSLTAAPRTLTIEQGGRDSSLATVMRAGGFAGSVDLALSGLPDSVSATIGQPALAGDTTTIVFDVAPSTPPGTYAAVLTGTATGLSARTDTISLTVSPSPSYSLSVDPDSVSAMQGENAHAVVHIARDSGFTGTVALTIDSLPAGIVTALGQSSLTGDSTTLTLSVGGTVAPGEYPVVVRGASPGRAATVDTLRLTVVAAPAGSISIALAADSVTLDQGRDTTLHVVITRSNFADSVRLAVTGAPDGATISAPPTSSDTALLTISLPDTTAIGSYALMVTASGANVPDAMAQLNLTVTQKPVTGGNVSVQFCGPSIDRPIWVAGQDGSGPWRTLGSLANDTYAFDVTVSGAVAYVRQRATDEYDLTIAYGTLAELQAGGAACASAGTKSITGVVSGLPGTDRAMLSFGDAQASVLPPATAFTLAGVADGPRDLIAARQNAVTGAAYGLIIRRGLSVADGGALDTLDFAGSEPVLPLSHALQVDNAGGESVSTTSGYFTTATSFAQLAFDRADVATARTYATLPVAARQGGDLNVLGVTARLQSGSTTIATRSVTSWFASAQDRTETLGDALGAPAVTAEPGAAYVRPHVVLPRQAPYDGRYTGTFSQGGGVPRGVTMIVTAGYLDVAGSVDLTMPMFSPFAGWNAAWALQPGAPVSWGITAMGWTGGGATPPMTDGTVVSSAARFGQFVP